MLRKIVTASALVTSALLSSPEIFAAPPASPQSCEEEVDLLDGCPVYSGIGLDVRGQWGVPGGPGPDPSAEGYDQWAAWSNYVLQAYNLCLSSGNTQEQCADFIPLFEDDNPDFDADSIPAVTITDLARFAPTVGQLVAQPEGFAVAGRPANFYSDAEPHRTSGTLLDRPIEVHWTPIAWHWNYGDGTTTTTDTGGYPWETANDDWTETPTSHVYTDRTDRTVTLTVEFTADLLYEGNWWRIPGTLPIDAGSINVKVFTAQTVLTRGTCNEYPNDPGCR